jgi:MerR family mercuric resistance operon transcriptional regulator
VRYYQRGGLLARRIAWTAASGSIRRTMSSAYRFIKRAQALGYSALEDIAELMSLSTKRDRLRVREITRERIAEIRERVARPAVDGLPALENLADCCAKAPEGSACSIIAALTGSRT